MVGGKYKD
jgi:hypothetical protein